ncbi:MAG: hypothetical protein LBQ39_08600 [Tannerellaceae bacterium]|jgi:hypothetical protein|nr:hypothetical protein [Tannerellaceae bacterium]
MRQEIIISIHKNEYLSDALKRQGFENLPSNCMINKTFPGIGATYCELVAARNSIIIEPNIPAVKGKVMKHKNALGIYDEVEFEDISHYLQQPEWKKIVTTSEYYPVVKKIMNELGLNMFDNYFLLFDECEKAIFDMVSHAAAEELMNDFFLFTNRSFISSTCFFAEDIRMKRHDFSIMKIQPEYEVCRENLQLITTNNIAESLLSVMDTLDGTVCIFCHAIETIHSLIRDVPELGKGYIFCDEEFPVRQYDNKLIKKETGMTKLNRYNLFTFRFHSGVDIEVSSPPHVIIISDLSQNVSSVIDPQTETIQIAGRFRKGVKSIVHISNIQPELKCLTSRQVYLWLQGAKKVYSGWLRKMNSATNDGIADLLQEAIRKNRYIRFMDKEGNPNPYYIARFIEKERIKSLYTKEKSLRDAYAATGCFDLSFSREVHIFSDEDRIHFHQKYTQEGRNHLLLTRFEQLEVLRKVRSAKAQERYQYLVNRLISTASDRFLYDCYLKYGSDFIRNSGFREQFMRKELSKLNHIREEKRKRSENKTAQ